MKLSLSPPKRWGTVPVQVSSVLKRRLVKVLLLMLQANERDLYACLHEFGFEAFNVLAETFL
jgi:hypothetical protein